jgi:hypothetical protein
LGDATQATEEEILIPSWSDCRRLAKIKAEQEQRLKMLRTRVDRLTDSERRVWKEVMWSQHRSLQVQEAQWRRQAQKARNLRREQETMAREQALRERFRDMRSRSADLKERPRLDKFEENRTIAGQVREDTRRLSSAMQDVREQSLKSKRMQVDLQRSRASQARLRRELECTNRERVKQDANAVRYAELQEEIQSSEMAIVAAEDEERKALSRLQNSQHVRSDVLGQLQEIRQRGSSPLPYPASEEAPLTSASYRIDVPADVSSTMPSVRRTSGLMKGSRSRCSPSRHHGQSLSQISEEQQEDEAALERQHEEANPILESSSSWLTP